MKKVIKSKFILTVGGVYSVSDYNTPLTRPREDDINKVNIGLDYLIQNWLTAGIDYRYEKKDSNYSENDYADTQFIISLSAVY